MEVQLSNSTCTSVILLYLLQGVLRGKTLFIPKQWCMHNICEEGTQSFIIQANLHPSIHTGLATLLSDNVTSVHHMPCVLETQDTGSPTISVFALRRMQLAEYNCKHFMPLVLHLVHPWILEKYKVLPWRKNLFSATMINVYSSCTDVTIWRLWRLFCNKFENKKWFSLGEISDLKALGTQFRLVTTLFISDYTK